MENRNRKILGNIFGIMAGIIWTSLGVSQYFLKSYANIFMVLIGIAIILLNVLSLKENLSS